jgi:glycosyltransferase involved in cell wall biosynthesis
MTKILFYPSGDKELPSSHLRVYEVAKELESLGHSVTIVDSTYSDENKKVYLDLAESGTIVYVQKIRQKFHKPESFLPYKDKYTIVYDVDDFHDGQDDGMIEMADTVVSGSHYVGDYCQKHNNNVHILCSITDTEIYKPANRDERSGPITIVWTESFANAYLEDLSLIEQPMRKMHEKYNIRFVLQGMRENRDIPNPRYQNLLANFIRMFPYARVQKFMPIDQYLKEGIQTLRDADIGVIPFKPDRVGKAAQNMRSLMSLGLGVIGTPGNEHEYVIKHGETGLLASTEEEWEEALERLITDKNLRLEMGKRASRYIKRTYSRKRYIEQIVQILGL